MLVGEKNPQPSMPIPGICITGDMRRTRFSILALVMVMSLPFITTVHLVGCGEDYELDYGQPAAQFLAKDLPSKAKSYIGKKITVKGTVARVDTSNPTSSWVFLKGGIECNLGRFKAMANSCKVGDTVFIDGFLRRCDDGDILIEPALQRDPTADFNPH